MPKHKAADADPIDGSAGFMAYLGGILDEVYECHISFFTGTSATPG
jgi:hypothetical protein